MQKLKLTILLLVLSSIAHARIGLADWSCTTPGGNEINNFSNLTLYLNNHTELDGLEDWYFYKDYVIGRLSHNNHITGYFAVNEFSYKIDTFRTEKEWTEFLQHNQLQPKTWTKWYRTDWTLFDDQLFWFFLLINPLTAIPILILCPLILYKTIRKEKFNLRKPYTIIFTLITGFVFICWLLEQFPKSI